MYFFVHFLKKGHQYFNDNNLQLKGKFVEIPRVQLEIFKKKGH